MQVPEFNYNIEKNVFNDYCVRVFSYLKPDEMCLTIYNYRNNYGGRAHYTIKFTDYLPVLKESINKIENYKVLQSDCNGFNINTLKWSKNNLLNKWRESFKRPTFLTCKDTYSDVLDNNGNPIPGMSFHTPKKVLHISGLLLEKEEIVKGDYPKNKKPPEFWAEKFLINKTPIKDWRQFKLMLGRFDKLTIKNITISGEDHS